MLTITEYDLSSDMFIVENEKKHQFPLDASTLAIMLDRFEEPETFIGLTFSVQVHA